MRSTTGKTLVFGVVLSLSGLGAATGAGARASSSGTAVAEAPRQVTGSSNPVRLDVGPALAVDPHDPSTVVMAVADARDGGCGIRVSRDGGLSWVTTAETVMPKELPYCVQRNSGPMMAPVIASDGTLYVGVSGSSPADTPNGPITALVARSNDLGTTSQTLTVAKPEGFTYTPADGRPRTGYYQWRIPTLAVDPKNPKKLYMGWRLWNGGIDDISFNAFPQRSYISTSDDGGATWTAPVDVLRATIDDARAKELGLVFTGDRVTAADTPQLVVAPDGTVYGFTKDYPPSPPGQPAPVSKLYMFKSSDGGKTWSTTVVNKGAQRIDLPSAAIDPRNGTLYLAYASRGAATPANVPANPSKIYVTASSDGGKTWSEPKNVTDDKPSLQANQYFPNVSVAPNGRVDVAWYDFRNDAFFNPGQEGNMGSAIGQRYWDVYLTYSSDSGKNWSPNVRVTTSSIDSKAGVTFNNQDVRAPIGLASTNSAAYVAWPDTRASGPGGDAEDAYFSRVRFNPPVALGARAGASNSSKLPWTLLGVAIALAVGGLALMLALRLGRSSPRTTSPVSSPQEAPTKV